MSEKITFSSHSEAIRFALKQQDVKNIDICKKLGINPGNLSSFLKNKRTIPHEKISYQIDDLCNTLDFRQASRLSHIADRLDLFISELKEF